MRSVILCFEKGIAEVEFIMTPVDLELPGRFGRRKLNIYSPQTACLSWADAYILVLLPFALLIYLRLTLLQVEYTGYK